MPLTVGDIFLTSTATATESKDWIDEVEEAVGGCCKAKQAQAVALYLVYPTA